MKYIKLILVGGLFLSTANLLAQEYSFTITSNGSSGVELSHNLKSSLTQRGAGWYDNQARYYDPILARFTIELNNKTMGLLFIRIKYKDI